MKTKNTQVLSSLLPFGLILLLSGCAAHADRPDAAQDNSKKAAARNPMEIKVSDTLLAQTEVGEPAWEPVTRKMQAAARIQADGTRMARVGSPVDGRITKLMVMEGQHVRRGERLADLHSNQLSEAEFAFLKAYSQQQLSKRAVTRADQLLKADVIGSAELQRREAELQQATAEVAASRAQLQLLGMTETAIANLAKDNKISSASEIVAPVSGTVLKRNVTIGQIVQPAETVFVIADLSTVWLVADIPEENSGELKVGKIVRAEIAAFPGVAISGRLSFVSSIVNPETRTVQVRMDLPNPQHKYKPDMLATMVLEDTPHNEEVIPEDAIVHENNKDYVFIETGPKTFLLRPVQLGEEFNSQRVVTGGVRRGERIVLHGAFHINNERKRLAQMGEG
jgi:membrane fusion protein, heavy metal efflux system